KEWPYYITPAEQTLEVQAQLDALIQTRVREDGDTLNPESITVLDPACGSGHILVVAYDALKAIYLERGYQPRAIPRLILEKNLYGLDIDDRAAQMAGFALLMKARADDRRLFTATDEAGNLQPPKLNVLSLQESKGLSVDELATHLAPFKVQRATITALVETFEHAKTFGSLIQIPSALKTHLAVLAEVLANVRQSGDMYATAAADDLLPLVQQAQVLAMQFDDVVANPPYMGGKGMNLALKDYAKATFPDSKSDLFAMFMERGFEWCKPCGFNSMVTMQSWMFLSSYEAMREKLLQERTIQTMAHLGARAFSEISGEVVQTVASVLQGLHFKGFKPVFFRLVDGQEEQKDSALRSGHYRFDTTVQDDFKKIPGSPVAYWVANGVVKSYEENRQIYEVSISDGQNITANNDRFLRFFWEINSSTVDKQDRWVFYAKGGTFRKWYGNMQVTVDWSPVARSEYRKNPSARIIPEYLWFKQGITWTLITSSLNSFRFLPEGSTFDKGDSSIFLKEPAHLLPTISFLNSTVCNYLLGMLSSTLNLQVDEVRKLPFEPKKWVQSAVTSNAKKLIDLHRADDGKVEESWTFACDALVSMDSPEKQLKSVHDALSFKRHLDFNEGLALEIENNRIFINAYGLQDELSPEVPESQITLARADREKDSHRLISYAIGCMMGRYSLDEPGLIYAHAGNVGFEPGRYATFPADADGIVPITDELWFADDACSRVREFVRAVWGPDTLEENMAWLAESLGTKASETPDETIRRYIADKFFKDHLQTYKKRPIYWLFSSGKQGAFQALVYLHRYHEGTLARLRAEYVVPLTGKMQSRIEMLQKDALAASSTAARNKLAKEVEKLKKKHGELLAYDEQLRHYADMRITLDLDDGVKVNYGKFGDLLEGVKVITG
ncbi:MAG: BREX-1 system adenine-specific DNA-methyltransferase PglX, partial [Burkholderiaceae bacterium]|nr:BREX-1 system adenine-specific DNA-methyltransferase PglX [Burkholderiaceae bacterium]